MGDGNSQLLWNGRKIESLQVKAETVCVMSCDSANFAGKAFSGAKNIIGFESGSGSDVTSSVHSLSRAGFAAAKQLINGKGPDAAVLAANGAIAPSAMVNNQTMTWMRDKNDVGDRAKRIK